MLLFLLLLASKSLIHGAKLNHPSDDKMVDGYYATIEGHPHQVSVRLFEEHYCGGSVISEKFIVTAAHCLSYNPEDYTVRLGSDQINSGGIIVTVKAITIHPHYDTPQYSNDVGIIELSEPVNFSDTIQPITLPWTDDDALEDGTIVTTTGFDDSNEGRHEASGILQTVKVVILNREECQESYGGIQITDYMVCANFREGSKYSCQGDSGGPLTVNSILFGIVSWRFGCVTEPYPGVYAYVPALLDFIIETTGL